MDACSDNNTNYDELEKKCQMAEQASRSKSDFLARMSHEIRTPLNAIMGMAELSLREELPTAATEHISAIMQAGANILDIVNDILDLTKIETGQLMINEDEYMVASLINDVLNIIKPRVLSSKLRFIVDVDCKIPEVLKGDIVRIRQVILNLLSNAVKYTDMGYIRFSVSSKEIDENNINFIINVQDSGRGIKNEDLESLYNEYTRFDMNLNKDSEGTGLGLAITGNLVSAMNGEILVDSVVGKGTVFTVVLPQEVVDSSELARVNNIDEHNVLIYERREEIITSISQTMSSLGVKHKIVSSAVEFYEEVISENYSFVFLAAALFNSIKADYGKLEANATFVLISEYGDAIPAKNIRVLTTPIFTISCANIFNGVSDNYTKTTKEKVSNEFTAPDARILIVDDINTNLIIARGLVEPYETQIDVCLSGEEAIKAVSSAKYDIVLMDYMMPEMDGLETVGKIRAMGETDPYFTNVPVVALTANSVQGTKETLLTKGFNDFLSKPIDTSRLHEILEYWIPLEKQVISTNEYDDTSPKNLIGIEETDSVSDSIFGLDINKGIMLSGGLPDNYYEALASFKTDISERIEQISGCIETLDLHSYTIYVHAIRSASANIGADEVSHFALELENAAIKNEWEFIDEKNDEFLIALKKLLIDVNTVLSSYDEKRNNSGLDDTSDTGGSSDDDPERARLIKNELIILGSALEKHDIATINHTIENLLSIARFEEKIVVRAISKMILLYEYKEAVEMINCLI